MSASLGKFALLNRHSHEVESGELFSPIDVRNIADFDQHWKKAIRERARQVPRGTLAADLNLQDHHWDWQQKTAFFSGRLDYVSYALECAGMTQGLMLCSLVRTGRESSQRNQHLVYVEYLHTAPWNRQLFSEKPLYKGVGTALLGAAISLSIEQEFQGRVGLHSLPQSDAFYRDQCGMSDLGIDPSVKDKLRYFEMTVAQAESFRTR